MTAGDELRQRRRTLNIGAEPTDIVDLTKSVLEELGPMIRVGPAEPAARRVARRLGRGNPVLRNGSAGPAGAPVEL
jgi:hypothetical protein